MDRVDVRCAQTGSGWRCVVDVGDGTDRTRHEVDITPAELVRLAPGASDPTALVAASFRFLLQREPKEAILPRFDLGVISRYFPEYERTIRPSIPG